jgi:hypothetical protein
MTCKIAIGEGYKLKDGELVITADVHRPRECGLIRLHGILVAAV